MGWRSVSPLRRSIPPGALDGPNRHEEMQRANDLVQELNASDVENPMTASALQAIGPTRSAPLGRQQWKDADKHGPCGPSKIVDVGSIGSVLCSS